MRKLSLTTIVIVFIHDDEFIMSWLIKLYCLMGQLTVPDHSRSMVLSLPQPNVEQKIVYVPLFTCKWLEVPCYEKVFQYENYKKVEVTYKFFENTFVHLEINKQKPKQEAGCPLNIGNEVVYGYKFKKNDKSEKIRPDKIFFRRKIFSASFQPPNPRSHRDKLKQGLKNRTRSKDHALRQHPRQSLNNSSNKQEMLRKLAQMKLLSKLELGARMARMIDGADGILTEHYIQFYSEVPIEKGGFETKEPGQKDKLCQQLKSKGFKVKPQSIQMAYSVFQKGYIARQSKKLLRQEEPSRQNRSIKFMVRACEEQINLIVCKLDGMTNMMSAIQNHLNYREIEKAMEKFEENMANMEQTQRLDYAEQMAMMLSKYNYYQNYHSQVTSYISTSRSSLAQSRNLSASRFQRKTRSPQSSNDSYDSGTFRTSRMSSDYESRNPISPVTVSPKSSATLRYNEADSPRPLHNSDRQHSLNETYNTRETYQPYIMWETAQQRLRNAINQNDKVAIGQSFICLKNLAVLSQLQTEALFGKLLLENGKTKYSKIIFERLLYSKRSGRQAFLCSQIQCMLAFLYHHRGQNSQALIHYQKALNQRFKFRNYSRKTAIIFNNLAVLQYQVQHLQKSLLWLHRGFRLGEYCADYELIMRSNYAMILAEKGQVKEAKMEMYKTHKNVEPYCNMEVLCKFHSNLGYLQLLQNVLDKAKANFQIACQLEVKYLLPNHYKPSVFLHNNIAIYHAKVTSQHKKSEWKKAASHLQKIEGQLGELKGLLGVQVQFNFGKVMKQNYKLDEAVGHFSECRNLLLTLKEVYIKRYLDRIDNQIQMIESQRIDEESEQSSCVNKISKLSRRSRLSSRHLESKINSN